MSTGEIFNGSKFESEKVKNILEAAYNTKRVQRLRLFYGKDGKVWNEENDICGYIGRSTGSQKIALLINNKKSLGGSILTDCIVGIYDTKTKKCLYWADGYEMPKAEIKAEDNPEMIKNGYLYQILLNGALYSRHKTEKQAKRLVDFMTAKRFAK